MVTRFKRTQCWGGKELKIRVQPREQNIGFNQCYETANFISFNALALDLCPEY